MGTTQAGKEEYEKIKAKVGKGFSYASDLLFEDWDNLHGNGYYSYEVYVGTDPFKPVLIRFHEYIEFNHQPFYVGYGTINHRSDESFKHGRNQCNYCFKTERINEIEAQGGKPRIVKIGYFQTKAKAMLVERKMMNLHGFLSFMTNSQRHLSKIPLTKDDCNQIRNRYKLTLPLTLPTHGKRPK